MCKLLDRALVAHGGLRRWNNLRSVRIAASITGAICFAKGRGDVLKNVVMTADTRTQRLTTDFPGRNKRTIFEPGRIVIETADGEPVEVRNNPKESFQDLTTNALWDDVHVAYFSSEALWTCLTIPFLYTYPGFLVEEISAIEKEEETWRRLQVIFPDSVSSHTRQQVSCFGPDGLLRRHDYTVDVLGGATRLNYASRYREVDGILVPTKRRVYVYQGDYHLVTEPLQVAIDMTEVTFS
jgi:hypothetical protein